MSVIEVMRDAQARRTALITYAKAHDKFSEIEQRHVTGIEAELAHRCALIALRAYRAELDDPE